MRSFFYCAVLTLLVAIWPARAQCPGQWLPGNQAAGLSASIYAQTVWDPDGDGPERPWLVVGGTVFINGSEGVHILAWDGFRWHELGTGMSYNVYALAVYNGELIAGGAFATAGGVTVNSIARWNGVEWQPLGTGMPDGTVNALVVHNGELIAGGSFTAAGGIPANSIARWNGKVWAPMGVGFDGTVAALAVFNNQIVAGGYFVARRGIAAWNGASWQTLGNGVSGSTASVRGLTVYNGELIAVGDFLTAGSAGTRSIARWNGTSWRFVGPALDASLQTATVHNGHLIVGGEIYTAGGVAVHHIVRWNGSAWDSMASGVAGPAAFVYSLQVYGADLIVGGTFSQVGAQPLYTRAIVRWDGAAWRELGMGMNNPVDALTVFQGELIAGGNFTLAGGDAAIRVARWDGVSWRTMGALGGLVNDRVQAFTEHNGALIAGIYATGSSSVLNRWNGTAWERMGQNVFGGVAALTVYNNEIIAGGTLSNADGMTVNRIARWNGSAWRPLGSGLTGSSSVVHALTVYNGELVAAGRFSAAGGAPALNIARWNGATWQPLGTGVPGNNSTVHALAVHEGALVVGGTFQISNGAPANWIARWNGSTWQPFGIVTGPVRALATFNGSLVAAGSIGVARWDGAAWQSLSGPSGAVALVQHGPELVVGGSFSRIGDVPADHWARWTGDGIPWAAHSTGDQSIAPGGVFTAAVTPAYAYAELTYRWQRNGKDISDGPGGAAPGGGVVAGAATRALTITGAALADAGQYACILTGPCGSGAAPAASLNIECPADFNADLLLNSQDFFDFLAAFFGKDPAADFNADTIINSQDFFDFLGAFFAGCD